jgi:hypothetical protein
MLILPFVSIVIDRRLHLDLCAELRLAGRHFGHYFL